MKIQGIEINRLKTTILLKHLKTYTVLIPFYFIFAGLFGVGGVGLLANLPMEEMWMVPIMCIVGGIAFFIAAIYIIKTVKCIKKELNTRTVTEEEQRSANDSLKKLLIACILIIVIVSTIISTIIVGSIDNDNTGSNSGEKCRNCGRKTDLVAGFGYCYDCYEGFADWQEDN